MRTKAVSDERLRDLADGPNAVKDWELIVIAAETLAFRAGMRQRGERVVFALKMDDDALARIVDTCAAFKPDEPASASIAFELLRYRAREAARESL